MGNSRLADSNSILEKKMTSGNVSRQGQQNQKCNLKEKKKMMKARCRQLSELKTPGDPVLGGPHIF